MRVKLFDESEEILIVEVEVPEERLRGTTQKSYAPANSKIPEPDVITWNGRFFLSAAMVELTNLDPAEYFEIKGFSA